MLSPLLTGLALSETHDVSRLLIFPIPFWTLVASSLVANLLQPLVLAKMPVVLGLAAGLRRPARAPCPGRSPGVGLSFVFMLAAVQVSSLLLLGLARNRRFQDLALFVGIGLGFVLSIAPLAAPLRRARPAAPARAAAARPRSVRALAVRLGRAGGRPRRARRRCAGSLLYGLAAVGGHRGGPRPLHGGDRAHPPRRAGPRALRRPPRAAVPRACGSRDRWARWSRRTSASPGAIPRSRPASSWRW